MTNKQELRALAAGNSPRIRRSFQRLSRRRQRSSPVAEFADTVRTTGTIAISMGGETLLKLLNGDHYKNYSEIASERATMSGDPREVCEKDILGEAYLPRKRFEAAFNGGRRFHFGALFTGGAGAWTYGSYCAVLSAEKLDLDEIIILARDSIAIDERYVHLGGLEVDYAKVGVESSDWAHRGEIASLKCSTKLKAAKSAWPTILCNHADYLEVIFSQRIRCDEVREVTVKREHYTELITPPSGPLGPDETKTRHVFVQISKVAKRRNIPILAA